MAVTEPPGVTDGTYTLVVGLAESAVVEFGAAGRRDLAPGRYAYVGSAFGPGGFSRLDRHRRVAGGESDARHWHVDYLLGHPAASVETDVRSPGVDIECPVARGLRDRLDPIPGIGASDCDCDTHLLYAGDAGLDHVRAAHDAARE